MVTLHHRTNGIIVQLTKSKKPKSKSKRGVSPAYQPLIEEKVFLEYLPDEFVLKLHARTSHAVTSTYDMTSDTYIHTFISSTTRFTLLTMIPTSPQAVRHDA